MKAKKHGGRNRGHLLKAHKSICDGVAANWQNLGKAKQAELRSQGITPEKLEAWQHLGLATSGDFSAEVATAARHLGVLVNRYKEVLATDRCTLEMNRRGAEIPLPFLPGTYSGMALENLSEDQISKLKFNKNDLHYLHETGHAAVWAMQGSRSWDALRLLSLLIRAAAENDATFFKELHRRILSDAPLNGPVERVVSALVGLKECYFSKGWQGDHQGFSRFYERETPSLISLLKLKPGKRPALTVPQIAEWIWAFAKVRLSERSLIRYADLLGIPREHQRGRRSK